MHKKIAILGFGRSGTSWVSDIISKSQGGIILFEPLFPSACGDAARFCYATDPCLQQEIIGSHFAGCLNGENRDKWLLRNHVNQPIDKVSPNLLKAIWRECQIIGLKEIRANFMLPAIAESGQYETIFVIRHPAAVISSLTNRYWFWRGDFGGLEAHLTLFTEQVQKIPGYRDILGNDMLNHIDMADDPIKIQSVLWAATHKIALYHLAQTRIPVLFYEDLFASPFSISRKMLKQLNCDESRMHPSFLFTPSMVTLKTDHDFHYDENRFQATGPSFFWKDTLSNRDVDLIMSVVQKFGISIYDEHGLPDKKAHPDVNFIA